MNVYDCKTATGPVENGRQVLTLAAVVSVSGQKALSAFGRVSGPLRSSDAQCFPGKHPGTGDFRDVRGQCGSRVLLVDYDCNFAIGTGSKMCPRR